MKYISIKQNDALKSCCVGGKAKNLFHLLELGYDVPEFIVIPQEVLTLLLSKEIAQTNRDEIIAAISQINFCSDEIEEIINQFPGAKYFAVRSSANDEDGNDFSFAGQFESFLFVTKDALAEKIKAVWLSAFSERVYAYRKKNNLKHQFGISVIIQKMIDADVSGVAFGINPVTANSNEKFISAAFGLGEGIVSGELNADNFIVNDNNIVSHLAEKTHKIVEDENGSTKKIHGRKRKTKIAITYQ